jgi:hypothetical protein
VEQQNERLVAVPLDDRLLTAVELPAADAVHLDPPRRRWWRCGWTAIPWPSWHPRATWPAAWRSMPAKKPTVTCCSPNTGCTTGPQRPGPPQSHCRQRPGRSQRSAHPAAGRLEWQQRPDPAGRVP